MRDTIEKFISTICLLILANVMLGQSTSTEINAYRVKSLRIPSCKPCDQVGLKVNLLFGEEVHVGDRFILSNGKFIHFSAQGDTLNCNDYKMDADMIKIYGWDQVDSTHIVKKTNRYLILKQLQQIMFDLRKKRPQNHLLIRLMKE